MRSRPARALVVLAVLCLAAACGDDDDDAGTTTTPPPAESSTTTTAAGAATVELTESDLGEILTSDGRTLYVFMPDAGGGASTCNDDCATSWPPLVADGDTTVGEGLDDALFASATPGGRGRADDGGRMAALLLLR